MKLLNLKLENFRNINNLEFNFNKNINIFIGNNAQGKTNIVESIYFLAITKSHRTSNELNMIQNDKLYTRVKGIYKDDLSDEQELSILLNQKGKKVTIDGIDQKKISNYLSRMNVIMFCPDDLEIIKGSPNIRRRYLNIELSQLRNDYLILLKEYNQILKQRNEYLKQKNNFKFDKVYYDVLTNNIIEKNIAIIKFRYDFIRKLNKYLPNIFNKIYGSSDLIINYRSFISEQDIAKENIRNILKKKFDDVLNSELLQKTTLLGCHKDDFKMYLNGQDVSEFCSQGQQRLSILCLKLSEIELFYEEKKVYPIILLDDIFSELDEFKKNNIIDYFKEESQIFITTTDINNIDENFKKKSDIYIVNNGNVSREE